MIYLSPASCFTCPMRALFVLVVGLPLAACGDGSDHTVLWKRTDGRSGVGDPELTAQFEAVRSVCIEKTRSLHSFWGSAASKVMHECMASRGYVVTVR